MRRAGHRARFHGCACDFCLSISFNGYVRTLVTMMFLIHAFKTDVLRASYLAPQLPPRSRPSSPKTPVKHESEDELQRDNDKPPSRSQTLPAPSPSNPINSEDPDEEQPRQSPFGQSQQPESQAPPAPSPFNPVKSEDLDGEQALQSQFDQPQLPESSTFQSSQKRKAAENLKKEIEEMDNDALAKIMVSKKTF
jgi:hypothetical protein